MRCRPYAGALLALLAVTTPVLAQMTPTITPLPLIKPLPLRTPRSLSAKRPGPGHPPGAKAAKNMTKPAIFPGAKAAKSAPRTAAASGTWIKLNTHLIGTMGETMWVNLAQAANIRFYQSGKTSFAAVGVGGSNYASTSDTAEIQKLRAYVLVHQIR